MLTGDTCSPAAPEGRRSCALRRSLRPRARTRVHPGWSSSHRPCRSSCQGRASPNRRRGSAPPRTSKPRSPVRLARSLALVAIVIGGLMFMFGEGGAKRQISGIVFGGGLALFAGAVPGLAVLMATHGAWRSNLPEYRPVYRVAASPADGVRRRSSPVLPGAPRRRRDLQPVLQLPRRVPAVRRALCRSRGGAPTHDPQMLQILLRSGTRRRAVRRGEARPLRRRGGGRRDGEAVAHPQGLPRGRQSSTACSPLWGFVDDHTFLTKAGALGVVFRLEGVRLTSASTTTSVARSRSGSSRRSGSSTSRFRVYQYLIKRPRRADHRGRATRIRSSTRRCSGGRPTSRSQADALFELELYLVVLYEGWTLDRPVAARLAAAR